MHRCRAESSLAALHEEIVHGRPPEFCEVTDHVGPRLLEEHLASGPARGVRHEASEPRQG